jgi:hypothetical protein
MQPKAGVTPRQAEGLSGVAVPAAPVKMAGSVFVFVPKCAFSMGGNIVQLFGGAIFALHNYLLIGQLRLKSPKRAGVYLKLVYFLHICYKWRKPSW